MEESSLNGKKDKHNFLYYLNWKHLSDEVKSYGYVITLPKALLYFAIYIAALGVIAFLYRLKLPAIVITAVICSLFIPVIILHTYQKMYNERRFSDATMYMQQMLDSFRNFKKVSKAISDTLAVYPNGPMKETLERARQTLLTDVSGNPERAAFKIIESDYPCKKLTLMHNFLERAENIGGDFLDGLDILQRDRSYWVERVKDQQALNKTMKKNVLIMIFAGALLILGVESYLERLFPIMDSLLAQITTVVVIICDLFLYVYADKKISIDWLNPEKQTDEQILSDYEYVTTFDKKEALKRSMIQMIAPAFFVLLAVVLKNKYFLIGLLLVPYYFMLPYIKYQAKTRYLKDEIGVQFPSWLLQIGLELQTKTVQTSIRHSIDYAPIVLVPELKKMMQKLDENPTSVEPYLEFMKDFYDPDIQQSMRSLYSISAGSGGNIKERIREIVGINIEHLNKLEKKYSEDRIAAEELTLIIISSLPSAGKAGVDIMAAILLYLANFAGSI